MISGQRTAKGVTLLRKTGGLLIAGGRSTRFGSEKATARFSGELMMDCAARVFASLPRLAVSARAGSGAERRAQDLGLAVLHDDAALPSGPLAGVLAGLRWATRNDFEFLATAPCDTPLLPRDLVERLLEKVGAAPAAFATTGAGEHPLCAVWSIRLQSVLAAHLQGGEHPAVRAFLHEAGAVPVAFDEAEAFANANTFEALTTLERRA